MVGGTPGIYLTKGQEISFSALSRAVVGGTAKDSSVFLRTYSFSALSRAVVGGTQNRKRMKTVSYGFSALSRAVVGGTLRRGRRHRWGRRVSVLSVEPWLVEPVRRIDNTTQKITFQCSQSSRGWWNRIHTKTSRLSLKCFSALSRAVVGGTSGRRFSTPVIRRFSALSRAVVGGT